MMDTGGKHVIQIQTIHVIMGVLVWVATIIFFIANLQAQANDTARRVKELEDRQPVTYQQMHDALQPIEQRADRIERKLDNLK